MNPDPTAGSASTAELNVFECGLDGINQIEASAGTGKTWNMCALYLRLLLERQLPVQQILVVTFTKAATAELRERIRSRIGDAVRHLSGSEEAETANADTFIATLVATLEVRGITRDAMSAMLELALQSFDEASIFTIHGFCQRALADAPFAAGMPFATDLQPSDDDLALRAAQDFWRRHISSGSLDTEVIDHLLESKDAPDRFAKLLQRYLAKPMSRMIWPDDIDTDYTPHQAQLDAAFDAAIGSWTASADAIRALMHASLPELNGVTYKAQAVDTSCAAWQAVFDAGRSAPIPDPDESKLVLLTLQRLVKGTKKARSTPKHAFFGHAETLLTLLAQAKAERNLARLRLLRLLFSEGSETLARIKREQRIQSYDDILRNVHAALHSDATPWLTGALLAQYPAALIDEFQDTDPLQFAIFDKIYGTGANPLFFVGDPKQAIYSFRNADLQTYLKARDKATARHSLAHNQRSSEGLIAAQNALFSANPRAFLLDGLDYQPVHFGSKPRAAFVDDSAETAALQIWQLPLDTDGQPLENRAARLAVERATAAEIARLLTAADADQVHLGDRPLRAGDIAVLVKSHAQGSAMRKALARLQVGSVELSQAGIFDSLDAEELECLLQAVQQPNRTGLLLAALATELLGHDAAAIDAIAGNEAALQEQIERFDAYRTLWRERGIGFMYRRLLADEGVSRRMLARADGERRMTNLLHLGEYLHHADQAHPAPDALLRWLGAARRNGGADEAAQLRLESDQNLVQIVTIHRSKGLEYPIVFCPFLWPGKTGGGGEQLEGREYHDPDGQPVIDFRSDFAAGEEEQIKAIVQRDKAAEFLRLVYVALTRAAHRCYLVAGCYSVKIRNAKSVTESTRSQLNWLAAGGATMPEDWAASRNSPGDIAAAWNALAASTAPHIGIIDLPHQAGSPVIQKRPDPASLSPQKLPPPVRDGWRMSSFSALQHDTSNEQAGTDHDARTAWKATRIEQAPSDLAADDILRFVRGASAGDTLHAILEKIDFADPAGWDRTIMQGLAAHPQILPGVPREQQIPIQVRMVRQMLDRLTATAIAPGVTLSQLAAGGWLAELEFNLPAPRLHPEALDALLAGAGYKVAPLTFRRLEGYLKGYIDMVFEADGQYYLLDWKSNFLGFRAEGYGQEGIEAAMAQHGYHLQYLLYALALHRYLAQRLPDYRYATHFGGVLYLFLRGVRPDWPTADGKPAGVYFHKPAEAVIEALDRMFNVPAIRSAA